MQLSDLEWLKACAIPHAFFDCAMSRVMNWPVKAEEIDVVTSLMSLILLINFADILFLDHSSD